MRRDHYRIFSEGRIGTLTLPNRLVRSATWDPSTLGTRKMSEQVVDLYREVAAGGVGLIITGDFSVVPEGFLEAVRSGRRAFSYEDVRIEGIGRLADVVHNTAPRCRIVAQISGDHPGVGPSDVPSPFTTDRVKPLSAEQIEAIVECFVDTIAGLQEEGFDGVEFHAAHGTLLSRFLSPYMNRRTDRYGGPPENRARIIREIVAGARERVGDFPILIKMNCTDYLEGGTDIDNFPALAEAIANAGIDAIEISGGMWESLVRSEEELGFHPVPLAEAHTRLANPDRQSYFLKYTERLDVDIPLILVGGNRDVERLEEIVRRGSVDFIGLCRPLISEPALPNRWLEGQGSSGTDCISCNSCVYDMLVQLERGDPWVATCLFKHDRQQVRTAQRWLASWVKENTV